MKHLNSKLKLSVSMVALMCGGGLAASPALAVTYSGAQTGVVIGSNLTEDLIVSSTGRITPDGLLVNANITGNLTNAGLIETLASGSSPEASISVAALDVNGTINGDFVNTGTIRAQATNDVASTATTAYYSNYANATAIAVEISSLTGDFTNTGTVSAVGSADLAYQAGTAATPATTASISDSAYAYAGGAVIFDANGTITNGAGHSITASATATADFQMAVEDGYVSALLNDGTASATATALFVANGTYDVVNVGTLSATASATETVGIAAVATTETGYVEVNAYVSAEAFGAYLAGTPTGFDNSGTITASAAASLTDTITADGATSASVYLSHTVSATAYGVYVNDDLQGDFSNSGSISAVATADLAATASVTDASSWASVSLTNTANAEAAGVYIENLDGTFANAGTGTISATAAADSSYDLSAVGPSAGVYVDSAEVSATATGVLVNSGTFDFSNSGSIAANAGASLSIGATATGATSEASVTASAEVSAYAYGVLLYGETTDFNNSGTITATASATVVETLSAAAQTSATVSVSNDVTASASAVFVATLEGDFTNTGTITATAAADLAVVADATDALDYAYVTINDDVYAYANAVNIGPLNGSFSNTSALSITASATAAASYDLSATGPQATVSLDNVSMSATATGVSVNSGEYDFTNSGSISATASAALDVVAAVNATDTYGYIWMDGERSAYAYGADLDGTVTSFTNSGSITATASVSAIETLTVAAGTEATVSMSNTLTASATAVFINSLTGDFTNSGTIAATASANLAVTASSSVAASSSAEIYVYDTQYVFALGVDINDMDSGDTKNPAVFSNSSALSITAAANAVASYNLSAIGPSAYISMETLDQTLSAYGANIDGGEYAIVNSGTISATANAAMTVVASAVGSVNYGEIYLGDVNQNVFAIAVEADGVLTGFDNSGTITAIASATLTETITASGVTSASVTIDNEVNVAAYGVMLDDVTVVNNSGTIAATASAAVTVTASAAMGADPGFVEVDNAVSVIAIGLGLEEPTDGLVITNSGTISATVTGSADKSTAVALLIGPSTTEDSSPLVSQATGVITVTNSGTISATSEPGTSYGIAAPFAPLPLVINQQGGSISGDVAIELVNDNADTVNWTGGAIHGIVSADERDVVNVFSGTGTPANNTVTADADFALVGGAALNIGLDDKAVTFSMAGTTTGTGEVNLNKNASLVMQTTGSIGAGTFNMDPASALTFIFNPTDAGDIKTTGDANIDGTLNAVALPGLYGDKGSHVVIATGGDVVGTFDNTSINGDTLLIDFTATVNPQDVTISWKRNAFDSVAGLTINSTSVATALEEGYDTKRVASKNTPELNDILSAMFTLKDAGLYDRVLNSWSGSEHAQVMRAAANLSEPYHMAISEHLNDIRHTGGADGQVVMLRPKGSSVSVAPNSAAGASAPEESRFAFWGRAFGRWADTRGDVEADGYNEDTFGAVLGGDFQVSQNVTLGVVAGYMDDKLDFDDGDLGKIKRWTIGGYLSATIDRFYIDGSLTYASDNYKVNRTIQYGNTACLAFNCTTGATSKYNGDGLMGHAEVGYLFDLGNGTELRPFAGLNYSTVDSDPFSETGGGDLGLDVLDGTGKSFQSRLGARLSGVWGDGSTKWIPELRAEWRHEFKDNPAWIAANLNGLPNDPFVAIGSKVTQDLAVVGAGITALMSNGVGVFFDYQGAFGSGYNSHAIQGGVRVKF